MSNTMTLPQLRGFLEDQLLNSVVPFWTKHAIDPRGGICTCINDDGTINSYDKLMWSQLRAIYTFSALYNRIEKRKEWLDIATQIFNFCKAHGRDGEGRWVFRVDREGKHLEGATSIYADGFALLGMTEYLAATGDPEAKKILLETYENARARLARPGTYFTAPYEIPLGMKAHGVSMMFSLGFFELGKQLKDRHILAEAAKHADQVMDHYRHPEKKAVLEYVRLDGGLEDTPAGRAVVPGHAIESMWFQIHQYQHHGNHERIKQAIECIRWHIEMGWDKEYGGILLGMDLNGQEPVYWKFADTKLWWPVTEAMYALLLAHKISGEKWALDWYWKVHEIAFKHYPVPVHGEWTQKLDRKFNKMNTVIALPVKDPFHLPRSLILCIELLRGA